MERIKYLEKLIPGLNTEGYKVDEAGMNNIVIVVGNMIFRFPRFDSVLSSMEREIKILEVLNNNLNLVIPNPEYHNFNHDELKSSFIGYKMIDGRSLKKDQFELLEDKEGLAKELANYLKAIHTLDKSKFSGIDLPESDPVDYFDDMYVNIKRKLFTYMREDARKEITSNFRSFLDKYNNNKFELKIVHGDFGPSNILVKDGRLSGIIDFGGLSITDPAYDFACMMGPFGYGEDFVRLVGKHYGSIDEYLERAKFYITTFALQDALFGFDNDSKEDFDFGMINYI